MLPLVSLPCEVCLATGGLTVARVLSRPAGDGESERQRQSRGADAGAEVDRVLAGAGRGRRGEQNRVMADAVAAQRLAQRERSAEDRVRAHPGAFSAHRHGVRGRGRRR